MSNAERRAAETYPIDYQNMFSSQIDCREIARKQYVGVYEQAERDIKKKLLKFFKHNFEYDQDKKGYVINVPTYLTLINKCFNTLDGKN